MDIYVPQSDDVTVHFTIGTSGYMLHLYYWRGLTYGDVYMGNTAIYTGTRIMTNRWILPKYRVGNGGNFRFEAYAPDAKDYVEYKGFNTKFRLVAYTATEFAALEENG